MNTTSETEFQTINPFALQSPFLLFYRTIEGKRFYQEDPIGCVTPDFFAATRYEIDRYEEDLHYIDHHHLTPLRVTIPVCAHQPRAGAEYEYYAGNQLIALDPASKHPPIHQAACGAKGLVKSLFLKGGPCGPVVNIRKDNTSCTVVAYFGIDLLFFPHGDTSPPRHIKGFTEHMPYHFTSIPRYL